MKLWLISQAVNNGYDTFDAAVVAAHDEAAARLTHPWGNWDGHGIHVWSSPEDVAVRLIGDAVVGTPAGVILGSFNAG